MFTRRGAGAYICGEESAMIESIEEKEDFQDTNLHLCRKLDFSEDLP